MPSPSLILASSSPRRKAILEALGLQFVVQNAAIDECRIGSEPAADMVLRLARAKAAAIPISAREIALGADTAVLLGEDILGKPTNIDDALEMLRKLSGNTHQVLTGVAVCTPDQAWSALSTTHVQFRDIRPEEARRYWQSGEPRGKAGAYAIQGRGGRFVRAIIGSYSGVVGLPVFETTQLLHEAGLETLPVLEREA